MLLESGLLRPPPPPGIVVAWRPGCWLACPSPVSVLVLVLVLVMVHGAGRAFGSCRVRSCSFMFMA